MNIGVGTINKIMLRKSDLFVHQIMVSVCGIARYKFGNKAGEKELCADDHSHQRDIERRPVGKKYIRKNKF